MYIDPSKPLSQGEKVDYLGSVLDALMNAHNARTDVNGDAAEFNKRIDQITAEITTVLETFATEVDGRLSAHTVLRGPIHGETKTSIGLGNVDNWRMGTTQEHIDGALQQVYANPAGLKAMVEARLTVDPKKYIGVNILPIASSGQLGNVPQWPFDWREGEVIQSVNDPINYYGETPWQFRSDSGVLILPSMNGSDILTQAVADSGRLKRACTQWGGTNVRLYNQNLDLRRCRPTFIRGEANDEPNNQLVKGSAHLFDRHSAYYMDSTFVGIRGYNRNRLPFDILSNANKWRNNWSGIVEVREKYVYNIVTSISKSNVGGFGDDLYLIMELNVYSFTENGLDVKNGPGNPAETTARIQDAYTALGFTVPAAGKIRILKRSGKPDAICIKLRDIITYTDAQMADVVAAYDNTHSTHIAFSWANRLKGVFSTRIPLGFYSKDKQYFTNYYLDLQFSCAENDTDKSVAINVTTLRDITASIQSLNANLQVNTTGRFVQYPGVPKDDVFHPLVFNGVFDSLGGHIKTYTFYNRQYVGYYQHNVTGVDNWLSNGDVIKPVLQKYKYSQMSNLNNDGMYGDHLRHIPLAIQGSNVDYLTYSRDHKNSYRWAIATTELDTTAELLTPTGHHRGPWRNGLKWIQPAITGVASFVISNAEGNAAFENTCLVFNTQNNFRGYARYSYDASNVTNPISFLDPVTLDPAITGWVGNNGGNWGTSHRQYFFFKNNLYWFSQTLNPDEVEVDGTDCHYGVIKNAYIDVQGTARTIRITGTIDDSAISKPLKVNTKASLAIDNRNVVGWDDFNATDVYIMQMEVTGTSTRYQIMVNLGPFNNFYFEFESTINTSNNAVTFLPNSKATDPVFPYTTANGFSVDYATVTAYPANTPHNFHVNFQSPVMLKKVMWSFRKTPGTYGMFAQSIGTKIVHGGLMNSIKGVPILPLGSIITANGANIIVKEPISAKSDLFGTGDELFVKMNADGTGKIYGKTYDPDGYEIEPSIGSVPCGFMKNEVFYHYDPDGWRNALLPIIDGNRLNFYGYGSSIPVFLGVQGSGLPINRFFQYDKYVP
jgi:hypothetical protein